MLKLISKNIKISLVALCLWSNILFGYCATISLDINNIEVPIGNWIVLAQGSWNGWSGWGVELFDLNNGENDGIYEGTVCGLVSGTYGYVYTITGEFDGWSGWGLVSNAPINSSCDFIPNDQWANYGFEIDNQDIVTQTNSWGECGVVVEEFSPVELLVKPVNGEILNYIYIPFEWRQFPNAVGYNLQVSESENFNDVILNHFTERTMFIAKEDFNWNDAYYWRVQPVFSNNVYGEWTDISQFSIGSSQFDLISEIYTEDDFMYDYTVFGDWNNYRTSIVDINGKEVWNSGNFSFMMNHVSKHGQLFGYSFINHPNATGVEVDYDEGIVWQAMQWIDQHEFKQISNGNYMGFTYETELGPIPEGDWTSSFQLLGYQADGITYEFPYGAQKLIEFDSQTKEEVWAWNPHDHYTKLDSDLYGGTWWDSFGNTSHDWTHSNAFFFDDEESAVYISSRHLSRITKIDYPSGNIIWMMGLPDQFMYSGDQHICSDLEFSFQHHIQKLDNGNLLFFDNGNLDYLFGNEMTSRAIEIEVVDNNYCNIVWEYILPSDLAAYGMGSVQSLENGNYFINSTGDGGTILEVDEHGQLLWKLNLGLSWPNGSGYRAYRVPSIHPGAFSVSVENYKSIHLNDSTFNVIELNSNNNYIKFNIYNDTGFEQIYDYEFDNIDGDFFQNENNSISINPYSNAELIFEASNEFNGLSNIVFNIKPQFHPNNEKLFYFNIYKDVPSLVGDINQDSSINILDIVLVVNHIIGGNLFNDDQLGLADFNSDSLVNILDIVNIVNYILSQSNALRF